MQIFSTLGGRWNVSRTSANKAKKELVKKLTIFTLTHTNIHRELTHPFSKVVDSCGLSCNNFKANIRACLKTSFT